MILAEHAAALGPDTAAETIYDTYSDWVVYSKGFELYPAQQDAVLALCLDSNVILATPTGTGKSMVALGAHFKALTRGERSIYTAPIKALVSEKFFELVKVFGAANVGMVTGDTSINPQAPIICATAEILAQYCMSDPDAEGFTAIIMDEFHFYGEPDRGWAWQIPLLSAHQAQFVLLSATLGDVSEIVRTLKTTTGRDTAEITGVQRPVPLTFSYAVKSVPEIIQDTIAAKHTPVYLVHFSQKEAAQSAQNLQSLRLLQPTQQEQLKTALAGFKFTAGYGQTLKRLLLAGIGVHHAGMLPKYRRLVEQLAQLGLLQVICGTDTLGVGINVPIRTVVFTSLIKFDGSKQRRLTAREFHQIAGRAGRAGYDTAGDVIIAAPEHEVANAQAAAKYAAQLAKNPQKKPKPPRKQKSEGVTWSAQTAKNLETGELGALQSRMRITNSMLLAFAARGETQPGELIATVRDIILRSHETAQQKTQLQREALGLLRSLLAADVLVLEPLSDPHRGKLLRLNSDGGEKVALHSPLALFGIAALELLDPDSPSYVLDLISIVEATLENPHQVLGAQKAYLRRERYAQVRDSGVEYDERQRILDEINYPQPLAELLAAAYEKYAAATPWVRGFEPEPKSVVRDFIENAFGFRSFVTHYDLERSEGVLLRYLTDVYRALRNTVPQEKRNQQFEEILEWLHTLIRQIDSSLLDEWEALSRLENGEQLLGDAADNVNDAAELAAPGAVLLTAQPAFRRMVQNAMFRLVLLIAAEDTPALVAASQPPAEAVGGVAGGAVSADAAAECAAPEPLNAQQWDDALDEYYDEYGDILIDGDARSSALVQISEYETCWEVEQVIADPDGEHGWAVFARVDLAASNELGEVALTVHGFRPRF